MIKVYFLDIEGNICVKNVDIGYTLQKGETFEDLRNYVKPVVQNDGSVIETASQEELQQFIQKKKEEKIQEFIEKKLQDGKNFYDEIVKKEHAELLGKPQNIVNPAVVCFNDIVRPILELIKEGDWYSALVEIQKNQQLNVLPSNEICLRVYNTIVQQVYLYVQNNYTGQTSAMQKIQEELNKINKEYKKAVGRNVSKKHKKSFFINIVNKIKSFLFKLIKI